MIGTGSRKRLRGRPKMRRWWHYSIWLLAASLLSGCATTQVKSSFLQPLPAFRAKPLQVECRIKRGESYTSAKCAYVIWEDFEERERLLRAYCLAAGGGEKEGQAEEKAGPPPGAPPLK